MFIGIAGGLKSTLVFCVNPEYGIGFHTLGVLVLTRETDWKSVPWRVLVLTRETDTPVSLLLKSPEGIYNIAGGFNHRLTIDPIKPES